MNIILMCASKPESKDNYFNTKRFTMNVEGERLIDRTIRLIREFKQDADIFITAPDNSSRFKVKGVETVIPKIKNPLLNTKVLWNKKGRTILLYADTWFSSVVLKTILLYKGKDWILFGRSGKSNYTGKSGGELFAMSFYPEQHKEFEEAIKYVLKEKEDGKFIKTLDWGVYQAMAGIKPLNPTHLILGRFFNMDDFTEDFDSPKELELWELNRKKYLEMFRRLWK